MARKDKNHHLEERHGTWFFRTMIKGKRHCKALSTSVTEARKLRDQYLKEKFINGDPCLAQGTPDSVTENTTPLFGEVAIEWGNRQSNRIQKDQLKNSTWRDWKSIANGYILPFFGNMPIKDIHVSTIEQFIDSLKCGPKRVNNILIPLRSIFSFAKREGLIAANPMVDVGNLKLQPAEIFPLTMSEVNRFLGVVPEHYRPFFEIAFYTGMRFGEMAALKWHRVNFDRRLIMIRETLVYGEEGRPKTSKSTRDINMLPPVLETLTLLKKHAGKNEYVFLDRNGKLLTPDHIREVIWKPALVKAEIPYRPPIQTRHTFATLMIDAGENLGWVQKMMGHGSLQMIYTRYYSWVRSETRSDGSAFMKKTYLSVGNEAVVK